MNEFNRPILSEVYRCPACHKIVRNKRGRKPDKCPNCRLELDWCFKSVDEVMKAAKMSASYLADRYGITQNAWIMSSDAILVIKSYINSPFAPCQTTLEVDDEGYMMFMGFPVNIVKGCGIVKAIIQEESYGHQQDE